MALVHLKKIKNCSRAKGGSAGRKRQGSTGTRGNFNLSYDIERKGNGVVLMKTRTGLLGVGNFDATAMSYGTMGKVPWLRRRAPTSMTKIMYSHLVVLKYGLPTILHGTGKRGPIF